MTIEVAGVAATDPQKQSIADSLAPYLAGVGVRDEGTVLTAKATSINFAGAGVTATASGAAVTVTISGGGGGGGSAIAVADEGTSLTSGATSLNFTGAGVTASVSGTAVTVNVPVLDDFPATALTYTSGNLTGYTQNGVTYVLTYTTVAGVTVLSTKVGGGRTVTYAYNGSAQLTGETFT